MRKLVVGNWKMNGSLAALDELHRLAAAVIINDHVDVAVALPATLIAPATVKAPGLMIAAQDVHQHPAGAHTGCISAAMAAEAGAGMTIVGHSERRTDQGETDAIVRGKATVAHAAGLKTVLCVGETRDQRDYGQAEVIVTAQLAASLPVGARPDWLAIGYEPVWAIGTGRLPSAGEIAQMHQAIRRELVNILGAPGNDIAIIYGGSVGPDHAAALLAIDNVDGLLVGGASLKADTFVPIIEAAGRA